MQSLRTICIGLVITFALLCMLSMRGERSNVNVTVIRQRLTCAPDYHPCGSLRAPPLSSSLPCCNENSYCYRRPPYFSQCRPRNESPARQAGIHFSLCAVPFSNCSNEIPCCLPSQSCTLIAENVSLCLPSNAPYDQPPPLPAPPSPVSARL